MSLAQPDFTAEVIAARNAGVEVMTTLMDEASVVRVIRSAKRQGFRPVWATNLSTNTDAFAAKRKEVEGVLTAAPTVNYATSPKLKDGEFCPSGRIAAHHILRDSRKGGPRVWLGRSGR